MKDTTRYVIFPLGKERYALESSHSPMSREPTAGAVRSYVEHKLGQGERGEAPENVTFVTGLLRTGGRIIPLLALDQAVAHCIQPTALDREAKQ